jgi:hypothetical protein
MLGKSARTRQFVAVLTAVMGRQETESVGWFFGKLRPVVRGSGRPKAVSVDRLLSTHSCRPARTPQRLRKLKVRADSPATQAALAHVVNSGMANENHLCLISNHQIGIGDQLRVVESG